jgi:hypothetical protein
MWLLSSYGGPAAGQSTGDSDNGPLVSAVSGLDLSFEEMRVKETEFIKDGDGSVYVSCFLFCFNMSIDGRRSFILNLGDELEL